jgi:hypothetical protein
MASTMTTEMDELVALCRRQPGLSGRARLAFLFVLSELRSTGNFPSPYLDLPSLLGVHQSGAYRALHELEDVGEMTKGSTRYWRSIPEREREAAILPRVTPWPF